MPLTMILDEFSVVFDMQASRGSSATAEDLKTQVLKIFQHDNPCILDVTVITCQY